MVGDRDARAPLVVHDRSHHRCSLDWVPLPLRHFFQYLVFASWNLIQIDKQIQTIIILKQNPIPQRPPYAFLFSSVVSQCWELERTII